MRWLKIAVVAAAVASTNADNLRNNEVSEWDRDFPYGHPQCLHGHDTDAQSGCSKLNKKNGNCFLPNKNVLKELLPGWNTEEVYRVNTAKVVFADYALLRADFENLRKKSDREIDLWLEANTFISVAQAQQEEFNTWIPHDDQTASDEDGKKILATRPANYGRAFIASGMDVKGTGSERPRFEWEKGDPRSGTMTLGEAFVSGSSPTLLPRSLTASRNSTPLLLVLTLSWLVASRLSFAVPTKNFKGKTQPDFLCVKLTFDSMAFRTQPNWQTVARALFGTRNVQH